MRSVTASGRRVGSSTVRNGAPDRLTLLMSLDQIKELCEIMKSLFGEGWLLRVLTAVWLF